MHTAIYKCRGESFETAELKDAEAMLGELSNREETK
jgi:hypothetical protein